MKPIWRCIGWIALACGYTPLPATAQLVTVTPAAPRADDTVTIVFDATLGNAALRDYTGPVYLHTGLITGLPEDPSGWKYVQGEWGKDDKRMRMQAIGHNRYRFRMHIRSFYGLPADEPFLQLAFVFRNQNGSLIARDTGELDVYFPPLAVQRHGPLEKVRGLSAPGIDGLPEVLEDGSLLWRNATHYCRLRVIAPGVLHGYCAPNTVGSMPVSEAITGQITAPVPKIKHLNDGRISLSWGDGYRLEAGPGDMDFVVYRHNRQLLEGAPGVFFHQTDSSVGPVTGLRTYLQPQEHLYGAGGRALSPDRRGYRLYTYNIASRGYVKGEENLSMSLPVVMSSAGYGLFYDSYRRGYLDLGSTEAEVLEAGFKDSVLSWYILLGETPAELVQVYTALTGHQPLPPRWMLGYIQSRTQYPSPEAALQLTRQSVAAGYPVAAVVIHTDGSDAPVSAVPDSVVQALARIRVRTLLTAQPFLAEGSAAYQAADSLGYMTRTTSGQPFLMPDYPGGPAGLLDVFRPEAEAWYWAWYRRQMDLGVAGWVSYAGEPTPHPLRMQHLGGAAESLHNLYGLTWARLLYQQHQATWPDQRWVNLGRAGYAGIQRYGVLPWSGEPSRSWEALQAQPALLLGAGLGGVAYMHTCIGGVTGGPLDEELFVRWMQFGVFNPVMRVHGEADPFKPEPVFYSPATQQYVKKAILLRRTLLPYTYTLAWENSQTGLPFARQMNFYVPEDENLARLEDQYFWGRDLLVVPILQKGQRNRTVYLPAGQWVDWYSGSMYPGQQARMIPVSPDRIPVFVRAGAVLPVDETYSQADNGRMDSLFLHIFPDADGKASGKVYLDDGHTPQPGPAGAYRLIHIETSRKGDQHLLALETSGNGYPDEPNQYVLTLIWHEMDSPPASLRWNGTTLPVTAVVFEPTTRIIRLQITAYPGRKGRLILTQISPNK